MRFEIKDNLTHFTALKAGKAGKAGQAGDIFRQSPIFFIAKNTTPFD